MNLLKQTILIQEEYDNLLQKLKNHELPDKYPDEFLKNSGLNMMVKTSMIDSIHDDILGKYGSWVPITNEFCKKLSDLIKSLPDQRISNIDPTPMILEVGCGNGMLSYGLRKYGIDVIATDNMSWERKEESLWINDIERLSYLEAFRKYKDDVNIIIISYPPYGDLNSYKMVKELYEYSAACRGAYLLIYIGELYGNCASSELFDFLEEYSLAEISETLDGEMKSFFGQNSEMRLYVI